MAAQKFHTLHSRKTQNGFAHLIIIIVLALAIPLSILAVSRQAYKRSRAQVPSPTPCNTVPCTPSPSPVGNLTARLYIEPVQGAFKQGVEIPAQVRVKTNHTSPSFPITVNAVQAEVRFDATKLQVVRVDDANSAFAIEAEETISAGKVVMARGNIQAVTGDVLLATVVLKALPGTLGEVSPMIEMTNSAVVSDVTNTDILQSAGSATYNITSNLTADINNDGKVDIKDLSILLSNWHQRYPLADIVFDGIVDVKDLSLLLVNWGKTAILP